MEEKIKVDMTRHQRPYERGPQTRRDLELEFAKEFPDETIDAQGEERYEIIEQRLRKRAEQRKQEKEEKDGHRT